MSRNDLARQGLMTRWAQRIAASASALLVCACATPMLLPPDFAKAAEDYPVKGRDRYRFGPYETSIFSIGSRNTRTDPPTMKNAGREHVVTHQYGHLLLHTPAGAFTIQCRDEWVEDLRYPLGLLRVRKDQPALSQEVDGEFRCTLFDPSQAQASFKLMKGGFGKFYAKGMELGIVPVRIQIPWQGEGNITGWLLQDEVTSLCAVDISTRTISMRAELPMQKRNVLAAVSTLLLLFMDFDSELLRGDIERRLFR